MKKAYTLLALALLIGQASLSAADFNPDLTQHTSSSQEDHFAHLMNPDHTPKEDAYTPSRPPLTLSTTHLSMSDFTAGSPAPTNLSPENAAAIQGLVESAINGPSAAAKPFEDPKADAVFAADSPTEPAAELGEDDADKALDKLTEALSKGDCSLGDPFKDATVAHNPIVQAKAAAAAKQAALNAYLDAELAEEDAALAEMAKAAATVAKSKDPREPEHPNAAQVRQAAQIRAMLDANFASQQQRALRQAAWEQSNELKVATKAQEAAAAAGKNQEEQAAAAHAAVDKLREVRAVIDKAEADRDKRDEMDLKTVATFDPAAAVKLQALARGHLARKRVAKMKEDAAQSSHWYNWFGNNKMATGGIATGSVAAIAGTSIMSVAFHNRGKTDQQIAAMHPLARWMTTAGLRTAKAMGMKWGRKVGDLQEMAEEAATKMVPAVDMKMDMGDVDPFSMDEASAAA